MVSHLTSMILPLGKDLLWHALKKVTCPTRMFNAYLITEQSRLAEDELSVCKGCFKTTCFQAK